MCKHHPMQILTEDAVAECSCRGELCKSKCLCHVNGGVEWDVTKARVNIRVELVPGNPLLTDHQHNLRLPCLKWVHQLWSRVKHVPFLLFIIMFIL